MVRKKKILYVITKSVWGGAQKYVFTLATNLPKDQFDITVVCGGAGQLIQKLTEAGVRTISIPYLERDINITKELRSLWSLFKICMHERPDIVHLNSSKAGGLGAIAARLASLVTLRKIFVVFTAHGWAFYEERLRVSRMLIIFFTWVGSLFQNRIITIDTFDYQTGLYFLPLKKLALIFNGIEPINFLPRNDARLFFQKKIRKEITEHTICIGTNAELTKNKGVAYLIEAASLLAKELPALVIKFLIIGDGEDRFKLTQEITQKKLDERVFFLGFLPEAKQYLKGFDIFLLPSIKEGLPYALIEAMQANVPVIATHVGGIPDLIDDEKEGILIPSKNAHEIAGAIKKYIENPTLREQYATNAKRKIETKFRIHDMVEKTKKLYLESV